MSQELPSTLELKVITHEKLLVDERAQEVSIPSINGYLGILPGHRPLVVAIGKGKISFRGTQKKDSISIQGGYAEIRPDKILVFTNLSDDKSSQRIKGQG